MRRIPVVLVTRGYKSLWMKSKWNGEKSLKQLVFHQRSNKFLEALLTLKECERQKTLLRKPIFTSAQEAVGVYRESPWMKHQK